MKEVYLYDYNDGVFSHCLKYRICLHYYGKELEIPSDSLNEEDINEFQLINAPNLESLIVHSSSLNNVVLFNTSNCTLLKIIEIENNALYKANTVNLSSIIVVFKMNIIRYSSINFSNYWLSIIL